MAVKWKATAAPQTRYHPTVMKPKNDRLLLPVAIVLAGLIVAAAIVGMWLADRAESREAADDAKTDLYEQWAREAEQGR